MKSVIRVLARPFGPGEVRFLGGVAVGDGRARCRSQVLREHYTAVVHASGCAMDRRLGIPGEDLPGSIGSGALVGWYCGHPDHGDVSAARHAPAVAVVGAGNVALDVARVLARTADELVRTDVPDAVLDALRGSAVRDVHVLDPPRPAAGEVHPGRAAPARRPRRRRRGRARRRPAGGRGPGRGDGPARTRQPRGVHRLGPRDARHRPPAHPPAVPAQPGADPRGGPGDRCGRRAQRADPRRPRARHGGGGDARRRAGRAGGRLHGRADRGPAVRQRDRNGAERRRPRGRGRRHARRRGSTSPAGSAADRRA